jgi:hypothetical protein
MRGDKGDEKMSDNVKSFRDYFSMVKIREGVAAPFTEWEDRDNNQYVGGPATLFQGWVAPLVVPPVGSVCRFGLKRIKIVGVFVTKGGPQTCPRAGFDYIEVAA